MHAEMLWPVVVGDCGGQREQKCNTFTPADHFLRCSCSSASYFKRLISWSHGSNSCRHDQDEVQTVNRDKGDQSVFERAVVADCLNISETADLQ